MVQPEDRHGADKPSLRTWLSRPQSWDCCLNPSFLGYVTHAGALALLQREGLLEHLSGEQNDGRRAVADFGILRHRDFG